MTTNLLKCDVVIFGGGVAGLWLLAELRQQGFQTLLLETNALGAGQTRYAQGIIHGGTKYALMGKITASSEAISAMPGIWRDCIKGKGVIDLTQVKVLSPHQCMWSSSALSSRMAGFFASKLMRSRTEELKDLQRPKIFQDKAFKGKVYNLDEPVLDTASVVQALAEPHREAIMHVNGLPQFKAGTTTCFNVDDSNGHSWEIESKRCVLLAGQGNEAILKAMTMNSNVTPQPEMQLRPLKMVMLRGGLPEKIYAHCLEANINPRITITSHEDTEGNTIWYMGGQLAEEGVNRTNQEQINVAQQELAELIPWLDLSNTTYACLDINRAEPKMGKGKRPDTSFYVENNNVITAWPTKLALAPKLSADIIQQLKSDNVTASALTSFPDFATPPYAILPWQEEQRWSEG